MNGPVKLAVDRCDGTKHAVKSFKKANISNEDRVALRNEAEIYLSLDHPHVARLEMVYETQEELHFVMEYMEGGQLFDRLSSKGTFSEDMTARITRQMLLAVAYLHKCEIAHRDLKLENFLFQKKKTDHVKLIDFGFSKFVSKDINMSQACGTLDYMAPEVFSRSYTKLA